MYKNIGEKIKIWAVLVFVFESILAVVSGLAILALNGTGSVLMGFLIILLGPFVAWVSSWILYGFGEIIVKLTEIERNTSKQSFEDEEQLSANDIAKKNQENTAKWDKVFAKSRSTSYATVCPHCGERVTSNVCDMCGKENNYFS